MARRHLVLVTQIPLWSMGKATGGPALMNTLRALGERYRVSLVAPRLDYVDPGDLPPGVEIIGFTHHLHGAFRQVRKLGWVTDTLGWYTFRSSAWPIVRDLMSKGDVDLVYGYEIYGVPVARRAADRFGVPMVARYQGTLMSYRRQERLASLRYHKHLRALATPADLYVMTDDGTMGDDVLRWLGHDNERILFLMNGVDRQIVSVPTTDIRPSLGIPAEQTVLLTVSRLMNWKRVDRAIRTLALLAEQGFAPHLVVVGTGPLEGRLKELASSLGLADRVHFPGGVARDELASYYRSADMLLSLYDYSNLANPVIESMLLGCPVVALGTGHTDHLVVDGVNGVLLDSGEPADIAAAVGGLLGNGESLKALGDKASEWAAENLWTWDERMAVEVDALEKLIG